MKVVQVKFCGLFGNKCLTYATCRAWAERFDAELQTDPWEGEILFEDVKPNPIRGGHDLYVEGCWFDQGAIDRSHTVLVHCFMAVMSKTPVKDGLAGCQLFEFSRSQLRRWFKFRPEFAYSSPYDKAFHLRYWDPHISNACCPWYSSNTFPCANISRSSYDSAAAEFGYDPAEFDVVHDREPHTKTGVSKDLQFAIDFQILSQAGVTFRANSSFSYLAAAIGQGEVFSPMMKGVQGAWDKTPQFCSFERGNYGSFWPGSLMGQSDLND